MSDGRLAQSIGETFQTLHPRTQPKSIQSFKQREGELLSLPLITEANEAFRFDLLRLDIDGMGLVFPPNRGIGTAPQAYRVRPRGVNNSWKLD